MIVQRHGVTGRRKDHRTGRQVLRRRGGKILLPRLPLGDGDVAGRLHKGGELLVGDFGRVHPEAVHVGAMHWPGIRGRLHPDGVIDVRRVLCSHRELAAGNPHHAVGCGPGWSIRVLDRGNKARWRRHRVPGRVRRPCGGTRLARRQSRAHRPSGNDNRDGDDRDGDPCPRGSAAPRPGGIALRGLPPGFP